MTVDVTAADDAPVNTVPSAQVVDEDASLVFSSGGGNAISISDVDANGGDMAVTLNATNGTLTLSGIAGLAFVTGDGSDDATMVFTGTVAVINTALEGMTFDPAPGFSGAASVQIITDDQGNTGTGGPLTDDDTVAITVNNPPTAADNTVVTVEDTAYTFTVADFLFSDVDGDSLDRIQITELETVGALQLSGVDVTLGQEILVADITAGNLKFVPVADQNGSGYDSFEFRVHDGTEYSVPASMTTVMTAGFDVDAEGFSYADDTFGTSNPGWAAGTYEAAGGFSGGGLRVVLGGGFTFAPISGGWSDTFNLAQAETVTVSLQYRMIVAADYEANEYGEIILDIDGTRYGADLNNSLFHQAGDGNGGVDDDTGWLYAEFDIALSAGNHTLTVGAYNNQATGASELVEAFFDDINVAVPAPDYTMTVDVTAADDAPVNSIPSPQSTDEDTALVFSLGGGNAISTSDVDANGGDMAVTLNATNGTLTLSGIAGLAFVTGDGSDDATMVFTGTVAAINTALEGMTFDPTPDYNGAASVQIITDDQGSTGSGGPLNRR